MNTQINMHLMCINASVCIAIPLANSAPANTPGIPWAYLYCLLFACGQYQSFRLEQQVGKGSHSSSRIMGTSSASAHTEPT